jgi:hypothetical protein
VRDDGARTKVMTRFWWTCTAALVMLAANDLPAFACSCGAVRSFQQRVQAAPIVIVGLVSVGEAPPLEESASNLIIVRPPFMGAGVRLAIVSVAKGEVSGERIRVWDLSYGECGNALRGLPIGTSLAAAIWPVTDTPATERRTWGAAAFIPESDYFAAGACGSSVQVLTPDEVIAWTGRKIPATPPGTALDYLLPSRRIEIQSSFPPLER